MKRRGSMQLSIEAIIILIIAMVLLGLGIAFITSFFKQGTSKLTEPFDAISFGCDPNINDPIKTSPTDLTIKAGDTLPVKICVYNGGTGDAPNTNVGIQSCVNTARDGDTSKPNVLTQPQTIKRTDIGGFNTIFTAKNGNTDLTPATYICTLVATSGSNTIAQKQVTITVS